MKRIGGIRRGKTIEKHQLNLIATAFRYSVQMTYEIDALCSRQGAWESIEEAFNLSPQIIIVTIFRFAGRSLVLITLRIEESYLPKSETIMRVNEKRRKDLDNLSFELVLYSFFQMKF